MKLQAIAATIGVLAMAASAGAVQRERPVREDKPVREKPEGKPVKEKPEKAPKEKDDFHKGDGFFADGKRGLKQSTVGTKKDGSIYADPQRQKALNDAMSGDSPSQPVSTDPTKATPKPK